MAQSPVASTGLGTFPSNPANTPKKAILILPPLDWCTPETLSPQSWVSGFSDNSDTFLCAISASSSDLVQKMEQGCCKKGSVGGSDDGCYHWCKPSDAKRTDDWAACISDYVYPDILSFGSACNAIGDIERKNAKNNHVELRPGPDPNAGSSLGRSSKLGLFLGISVLLKLLC
jgi:hypothetical protein